MTLGILGNSIFFLILSRVFFWIKSRFSLKAKALSSAHTTVESGQKIEILVVLGSGGHTAELLMLIKEMDLKNKVSLSCVVADTDRFSRDKALEAFSQNLQIKKEAVEKYVKFYSIKRSREVGQSYFTSLFTTLISFFESFGIFARNKFDLILVNGPGTCIPICFAFLFLEFPHPEFDSSRQEMSMHPEVLEVARRARESGMKLSASSLEQRNSILKRLIEELNMNKKEILEANKVDLENSAKTGIKESLKSRLIFDQDKLENCVRSVKDVIELEDPLGKCTLSREITSNGLELYKKTCPIGVILVIFEARPEVAIQISSLAIKSGNAVILKGGKEAINSNKAIISCIQTAISKTRTKTANDPEDKFIQMVFSREEVHDLLQLSKFIDLVIPRGSSELVQIIQKNTCIPVLGHADGVCMLYLHVDSNLDEAVEVVLDSKADYPAACNSIETLLVHGDLVSDFFPKLLDRMKELGLKIKFYSDPGCMESLAKAGADAEELTEALYHHEFGSLEMCVKSVSGLEEAISHINRYGSHHTDVILTRDREIAESFLNKVDSACVFHNCSSRFSDGYSSQKVRLLVKFGPGFCSKYQFGSTEVRGILLDSGKSSFWRPSSREKFPPPKCYKLKTAVHYALHLVESDNFNPVTRLQHALELHGTSSCHWDPARPEKLPLVEKPKNILNLKLNVLVNRSQQTKQHALPFFPHGLAVIKVTSHTHQLVFKELVLL
ncbi:glutamate-5-semialdehyde dehydrogenase [Cryptosporidium felis]|nr:glutamate-5-semialdehyde dehydrogenase [Cryptosporidium felis]